MTFDEEILLIEISFHVLFSCNELISMLITIWKPDACGCRSIWRKFFDSSGRESRWKWKKKIIEILCWDVAVEKNLMTKINVEKTVWKEIISPFESLTSETQYACLRDALRLFIFSDKILASFKSRSIIRRPKMLTDGDKVSWDAWLGAEAVRKADEAQNEDDDVKMQRPIETSKDCGVGKYSISSKSYDASSVIWACWLLLCFFVFFFLFISHL